MAVFLLAYVVTEAFIIRDSFGDNTEDVDVVVVLGAGVNGTVPSYSLRTRLDAARKALESNPDALCIVTGGKGAGEDITEAQCMFDYLTANGIEKERIIKEEKASSTDENVRFSIEIIKDKNISYDKLAVVSSEYHLFRSKVMFKKYSVSAFGIPAKTGLPVLKINYFL